MSIDSLKSTPMAGAALRVRSTERGVSLVYSALMAASFVLAYLPTYARLASGPWQTEQEGHGPLIILAAAWLAWRQRDKLSKLSFKPAPIAGWVILLGGLFVMAATRSQDILMFEVASQIPVLLGCVLLVGGWRLARVFAFPLAFLIFSVPPPGWLMDAFTVPLKAWISDVVTNFLYAFDYPIAQNGVMIMIGSYELMVKDACSGMNSIFALSAIGVFYMHEFVHDNWSRKLILALSIIPITILANFFRVLALVLASYYLGVDQVEGLFHDLTGIALFIFALALFFVLDSAIIAAEILLRKPFSRGGAPPQAA